MLRDADDDALEVGTRLGVVYIDSTWTDEFTVTQEFTKDQALELAEALTEAAHKL